MYLYFFDGAAALLMPVIGFSWYGVVMLKKINKDKVKNKMIKIISLILLCIYSTSLYANGSSGWRTIKKVQVEGDSYIVIHPSVAWENPDFCGTANYAVIPLIDNASDKKLSVALSAYMSGKKLGLWFTGCKKTPWGDTAPIIYTLTISD